MEKKKENQPKQPRLAAKTLAKKPPPNARRLIMLQKATQPYQIAIRFHR
jgi:hypothetical protein